MIQMPMREEHGVCFRRGLVKLVYSLNLRQDSEFLKAFLVFRRKERRRIKLFFSGKRHAEIKENPGVSVLKQNFVSANLVNSSIES